MRADFRNCTHEIPVLVNNGTLKFADPFTWTLRDFPTVMPCSHVMPVRWRMAGRWYCATPHAQQCEAPIQLEPQSTTYKSLGDFTKGAGRGIFTSQQRKQHGDFQRSQSSRQAVVAKVTNAATKGSSAPGRLGSPLDGVDVKDITMTVGSILFPLFPLLGEAWSISCGILLSLVVFKTITGCIIRGVVLYKEKGCGLWMVGAMWSTLFAILRAPPAILETAIRVALAPLKDDDVAAPLNRPKRHHRGARRSKRPRSDSDEGSDHYEEGDYSNEDGGTETEQGDKMLPNTTIADLTVSAFRGNRRSGRHQTRRAAANDDPPPAFEMVTNRGQDHAGRNISTEDFFSLRQQLADSVAKFSNLGAKTTTGPKPTVVITEPDTEPAAGATAPEPTAARDGSLGAITKQPGSPPRSEFTIPLNFFAQPK